MPPKLDLSNNSIAFQHKSKKELSRAYRVFKLLNNNFISSAGSKITDLALRVGLPIEPIIRSTIYAQFCGGESIEACESLVQSMYDNKIYTNLDYAVEVKSSEAEFDQTLEKILEMISFASTRDSIPFISLKMTGLARTNLLEKRDSGEELISDEQQEFENVQKRLDKICSAGSKAGMTIFVDAEESWIQDSIDWLAAEMMKKFNKERAVLCNTIQFYRWDRLDFLYEAQEMMEEAGVILGLKLVRGAYMEKERAMAKQRMEPSPIHPDKDSTDQDYNLALTLCLKYIDRIFIYAATHNDKSCLHLADLMNKQGLSPNHPNIFFSQLYGMADHITYNLAQQGYNVAKYLPYGPVRDVIPYLIRRAKENSSMRNQMSRELSTIYNEIQRRKIKGNSPS